MTKVYYVCDICGKEVNRSEIPTYDIKFHKVNISIDPDPPYLNLPMSKEIDVCAECINRLFGRKVSK